MLWSRDQIKRFKEDLRNLKKYGLVEEDYYGLLPFVKYLKQTRKIASTFHNLTTKYFVFFFYFLIELLKIIKHNI